MAAKTGQFAKVSIKVGATTVTVAQLRDWSISVESEKIDTTAAGDSWEKHEIGLLSWEGDATFIDADQYWLAHVDKKVEIEFFDKDTDTTPVYKGTASFDFDRSVPYDDVIETSVSFTGDGALLLG